MLREVQMNDGRLREGLLVRLAGTGLHGRGRSKVENLEEPREAVAAHVAERTAAEVVPPAPDERQVGLVVRTHRRRTHPHVPVEVCGRLLFLLRPFDPLRPVGAAGPVVDLTHAADGAIGEPVGDRLGGLTRRVVYGERRGDLRFARYPRHATRLSDRVRHRFLAEHVLALPHRRDRYRSMPVIGGRHVDGIQAALFVQQLPVILVGVAALVRARGRPGAVVGLHELLGRLAAADAQAGRKALGEPHLTRRRPVLTPAFVTGTQQPPDGVQRRIRTVFGVLLAALVDVAHRNHLDLRALQQVHHDDHALAAHADGGQRDLVARRDKPRAAQHVPRNDGECRGGGELPSCQHTLFVHFSPSTRLKKSENDFYPEGIRRASENSAPLSAVNARNLLFSPRRCEDAKNRREFADGQAALGFSLT